MSEHESALCGKLAVAVSIAVVFASVVMVSLFAANYTPNAIANLAYGPYNERQANSLDLYLPEQAHRPYPLIVWIHGGGWVGGDKAYPPCKALLKQGFAVASINYRLSSQAKFPAQLEDCQRALAWLVANGDKYNLDMSDVGIWGASAGGHLALLVGTRADTSKKPTIKALCDWCGPTDLFTFAEKANSTFNNANDTNSNPIRRLLGGLPTAQPELAKQASPAFWIKSDLPPVLIMHGDADTIVQIQQSEEMKAALDKAHVPCEFEVVSHGQHNFFNEETEAKVTAFFKAHLLPN